MTKLSDVIQFEQLPVIGAQELYESKIEFYITDAAHIHTQYGDRVRLTIVGEGLIPSVLFLGRNTFRDQLVEYFKRNPGAKIGPVRIVRAGRAWRLEDAS